MVIGFSDSLDSLGYAATARRFWPYTVAISNLVSFPS